MGSTDSAKPSASSKSVSVRILVFDSGVGGLSICREIMAVCGPVEIHYLSDNKGFPYGEKPEKYLIDHASRLLLQATDIIKPSLIVIACNTASTVVLPRLRQQLAIPVIGVVPAIKTAARLSKTHTIALLATPATTERRYTEQLIKQYADQKVVIRLGSSELVRHIEDHLHGDRLDRNLLKKIVETLKRQPGGQAIDTVVLGCTHFPLIKSEFEKISPEWQWIDSGKAVASRVNDTLQQNSDAKLINARPQHTAWLTQWRNTDAVKTLFYQYGFNEVQWFSGDSALKLNE